MDRKGSPEAAGGDVGAAPAVSRRFRGAGAGEARSAVIRPAEAGEAAVWRPRPGGPTSCRTVAGLPQPRGTREADLAAATNLIAESSRAPHRLLSAFAYVKGHGDRAGLQLPWIGVVAADDLEVLYVFAVYMDRLGNRQRNAGAAGAPTARPRSTAPTSPSAGIGLPPWSSVRFATSGSR